MSWKWLDGNYVLENKPAVLNMQIILLADLKLIAYQWKWRNDNISLRDSIFCRQHENPASGTEEAFPAAAAAGETLVSGSRRDNSRQTAGHPQTVRMISLSFDAMRGSR